MSEQLVTYPMLWQGFSVGNAAEKCVFCEFLEFLEKWHEA